MKHPLHIANHYDQMNTPLIMGHKFWHVDEYPLNTNAQNRVRKQVKY